MSEVVFRVAKEWDVVRVKRTEAADARVLRCLEERLCTGCLQPIPPGEKVVRGQCQTCYPGTRRKIRQGKTSEKELMRDGELLPSGPPGPKPKNEYTRKLAEL